MNWKLFIAGISFFLVGFFMYLDVRKRKPASDKTAWKGQLFPQYIQYWIWAIVSIILGLVFIFESV